jgi:hypothetical protein
MRRFLLTLVLSCLFVPPTTAAEPVDAVWREHEIEFTFMGLDVAYSCDLVEARITVLLSHVGAANVDVQTSPCPGFDHPQRRLPITARFSALVPAGDGDVDMVKAVWSEVELGKRRPQSMDDRDCELLEYFQRYLLSTIEHEVIAGETGCDAARHSISGLLRLKVLMPVTAGQ